MTSRSTRPWVNRVEMCVLCGQSSFTSAQHISLWEVKRDCPPFWMRRSEEKKMHMHMHIYPLSIWFNIFIFVLNCICGIIMCISLCVYIVSQPVKRRRASHAVCGCVCVSVGVCECVTWVCFYWVISLAGWFDLILEGLCCVSRVLGGG